jgi:beta-glucosidase/6-phospho-beta-glucosidase/beta-galactosidase
MNAVASEAPTSAERGFPDGFYWGLGLISVDFETQQRIPKLSAEWFREAARQNAVF